MDKKINISEKRLKKIVNEIIDKLIKEGTELACDIDITKIPIEDLKAGYKDLRLVPTLVTYGNPLYEPATIAEAIGDIVPPDDVVNGITTKYRLPKSLVVKIENHHKIYVYSITACIGINDKLIENDMNKLGYFLSVRGNIINVAGMKYQILQFEPNSQLQDDITDEIKLNNKVILHWTQYKNINNIMQNGLIPYSKNKAFNYPPRIYFMESGISKEEQNKFGRLLYQVNGGENRYALLSINTSNLDDSIRFFYDPNSAIGIYTEQPIPSVNISIDRV